jgi:alkylation response protein AidB-like acyl-CoA dehydrogenase
MSAAAAVTTVAGGSRPNAALWDEVQAWLTENWDPDRSVDEWWKVVAAAGWTAPHFAPDQGGRGLPRRVVRTVRSAFRSFGALRPPGGLGLLMAAPTILTHGTAEQIDRLVPSILDGQVAWCQLFSEPGAGSDLAGLTTRATRDGDTWIIRGQKVWSSQAVGAEYGMLLARTNFDVPKHKGISWFAFPLDQPGVTVRPLREMTGDAVFNEIFIDDAVCSDDDLIGGLDNGWAITQTTLHFERTGIGAGGIHAGFPEPGHRGGMLGRSAGDAARDEPEDEKLTLGYDDVDPPAAGPSLCARRDWTVECPAGKGGGEARWRTVRGQHRQAQPDPDRQARRRPCHRDGGPARAPLGRRCN